MRQGETVVVITDLETLEIADALIGVVKETTRTVRRLIMEDFGPRPDDGSEPLAFPSEIAEELSQASASIYAATGRRGEIRTFRMPMLKAVESNPSLRHAHMINITREVMETGMSADYDQIQQLSARVFERVKAARSIRVTAPRGTDFTVKLNPAWKWVVSDGRITPVQWRNLPDGEVFTCAESADGRAVVDGCLGDHFSALGSCEAFPVTIDIKDGVATRLRCPERADLDQELNDYVRQDANSNRIGEFAIGTNIGLDRIIGNLLQDEKFPGVHIALGHGHPDKTGSPWESVAHLDVVMRSVTIEVDGEAIMRDGKFLI